MNICSCPFLFIKNVKNKINKPENEVGSHTERVDEKVRRHQRWRFQTSEVKQKRTVQQRQLRSRGEEEENSGLCVVSQKPREKSVIETDEFF